MKKESTYYLLLASFLISLLSLNAHALQFDSILDRNLQNELFEGSFNVTPVVGFFELKSINPSFHFSSYLDAFGYCEETKWVREISLQFEKCLENLPEIKKRNLITQYFAAQLSDMMPFI